MCCALPSPPLRGLLPLKCVLLAAERRNGSSGGICLARGAKPEAKSGVCVLGDCRIDL